MMFSVSYVCLWLWRCWSENGLSQLIPDERHFEVNSSSLKSIYGDVNVTHQKGKLVFKIGSLQDWEKCFGS